MQDTQSNVLFRGDDGLEVSGKLTQLTQHAVTFEVFQPDVALRTSHVFDPIKIRFGDRDVYSGRAVLAAVIPIGTGAVCEAHLSDPWMETSFLNESTTPQELREALKRFLGGWQQLYRVMPEFKVVIADMESFLDDLRVWLGQIELGVRSRPAIDQGKVELEVMQEFGPTLTAVVRSLFDRFEAVARKVPPEQIPTHQAFGRRLIHPLLLSSPFVHRTFAKPLGYAGDYEMVNMMVRNPAVGPTLFAKAINIYALDLPPIIAHRNRLEILRRRLCEEAVRKARGNERLKVLNVGCGPAQEIQRFLAQDAASDVVSFTLVDFNEQTIAFTERELRDLKAGHGRRTELEFVRQSVQQILKQASKKGGAGAAAQYDFVYCAGLFDYLSDQVCRSLMNHFYDLLKPGGVVLSTNVDDHPSRLEMEYFLEWHLIYRNHTQMWNLVPSQASPSDARVYRDATGVNLFLEARKPDHA
jgi:extracellular factor (EF) 3-hydroxypalmitic acid methyl ester biosynthesis protein